MCVWKQEGDGKHNDCMIHRWNKIRKSHITLLVLAVSASPGCCAPTFLTEGAQEEPHTLWQTAGEVTEARSITGFKCSSRDKSKHVEFTFQCNIRKNECSKYRAAQKANSKQVNAFSVCVPILSLRTKPFTPNVKSKMCKGRETKRLLLHTKKCQETTFICKVEKDWLAGCLFSLFILLFIWWRKLQQVAEPWERWNDSLGEMVTWGWWRLLRS